MEVELADFKKRPTPDGLKQFYSALMTMDADRRKRIVAEALGQARGFQPEDPVFEWMLKLAEDYPDDIGVLSPILLNLICLEPGQAIFLDAGQLHAYLEGTGIELMANSDNVLPVAGSRASRNDWFSRSRRPRPSMGTSRCKS